MFDSVLDTPIENLEFYHVHKGSSGTMKAHTFFRILWYPYTADRFTKATTIASQ